jgi:hypothetical protein
VIPKNTFTILSITKQDLPISNDIKQYLTNLVLVGIAKPSSIAANTIPAS